MRTAGLMPPSTSTWPTPEMVLMRCAISVSARSDICAQRHRRRGQRERQDRRIGRVHLGVGRRERQSARQRRAGGGDGGLHVLGGGVDVAVERELQRHLATGRATTTRSSSRAPGIWPSWRSSGAGDEVRHRVGIGAGQLRRHLDGREIDLRQRRDRQVHIAEPAGEQRRDGEQRRRDRPADEGRRDAHCGRALLRRRGGGGAGWDGRRRTFAATLAAPAVTLGRAFAFAGLGYRRHSLAAARWAGRASMAAWQGARTWPGWSPCIAASARVAMPAQWVASSGAQASRMRAKRARGSASPPAAGCGAHRGRPWRWRRRIALAGEHDARIVLQAREPGGDDALARRKPDLDDRLGLGLLGQFDRADLDARSSAPTT